MLSALDPRNYMRTASLNMTQPTLEVHTYLPKHNQHQKTPLVFVHGAFAGAWCWASYFVPYFVSQGYPCYTFSLRGHGESEGKETLNWTPLEDYVTDLNTVLSSLDIEPVIIGHSMGGMIVQKYLETKNAKAAILLSSVPSKGLADSCLSTAIKTPLLFGQINLMQTFGPSFATLDTMKQALFATNVDEAELKGYFDAFAHSPYESTRAILDMIWMDLPKIDKVNRADRCPILVAAGEEDAFFSPEANQETAKAYDADLKLYPHLGHAIMLEKGWEKVATDLDQWIQTTLSAIKPVRRVA